jgi:hypothetical protein
MVTLYGTRVRSTNQVYHIPKRLSRNCLLEWRIFVSGIFGPLIPGTSKDHPSASPAIIASVGAKKRSSGRLRVVSCLLSGRMAPNRSILRGKDTLPQRS